EQIFFAAGREPPVEQEAKAGGGSIVQAHLDAERDISESGCRAEALAVGGQYRVVGGAGEIVGGRGPAEGPDLRITLTAELRLHNWNDQPEIEIVGDPEGHIHRCRSYLEVHRQLEIHHVVLENRDTHQRAVTAELRAAAGKIDVLVGEGQIEVIH